MCGSRVLQFLGFTVVKYYIIVVRFWSSLVQQIQGSIVLGFFCYMFL